MTAGSTGAGSATRGDATDGASRRASRSGPRAAPGRGGARRRASTGVLALALLGAVAGLLGCDLRGAAGDRLAIGVILPFSGELSDGAEQVRRALEMAANERASDVRYVFRDDGGKPGRAAELVHELADEGVAAIVGTMSSPCALAAAERAETLHVPFVTPMATNVAITRGREWAFRMCFTDPQQGERMAEYAYRALELRRVAVIRDVRNDYSMGLADAFTSEFLSRGGRVVGEWSWRSGYDRGDEVQRWIASLDCDALYLPLYGDAIRDILDGTEPYWRSRPLAFLGGDGWHTRNLSDVLAARATVPQRIAITAHFARDERREGVAAFVARFRRESDGDEPTSAAALGYDIGALLADATRDGDRSREAIRDGLRRELAHFVGLTGDTFLDPASGRIAKAVPVLSWSDGAWRTVEE